MATVLLSTAGAAIGSSIGGSFLGISATAIGGAVGTFIGGAIDQRLSAPGNQTVEGPRLSDVRVTSSTEGAVLPRVFGRMRVGGNVIWATDFREEVREETSSAGGGKGGGGSSVTTREFLYYASFAVAIAEGPVGGIARVWADGKPLDLERFDYRFYPGSEAQDPDPLIESLSGGAGQAPAYRGTAYIVFDDMALQDFGNRLPQLSFEIIRPSPVAGSAEQLVRSVTMIPSAGEFVLGTTPVVDQPVDNGPYSVALPSANSTSQNRQMVHAPTNLIASLNLLQASVPSIEEVSLVVSWFGSDLRCGENETRPKVELSGKQTKPYAWSVNGVSRSSAAVVSKDPDGDPYLGGTPADRSVIEAIQEIKARGLRVAFYPFILMDVPPDNNLPDPYSDNASVTGQPSFPWRGRITPSPAVGFAGSPDQTGAVATQVAAFFGSAAPGDFIVDGDSVSWDGLAGDWGLRRMILHYAHLCTVAGGVDQFLIGTEMRTLTTSRSGASTYPAVSEFVSLLGDVRSIMGAGVSLSYAADWSEYFGHQPGDGSGDVFFHLDPLWSDADCDFVAIDNYMPLSDWRDGSDHLDALAGAPSIYDLDYLRSNILGGEGFDYFYADPAAREAQTRSPLVDTAEGKDWVFRFKDLPQWWSNQHFDRPAGVESGTATGWVPESKPIVFTELGVPAVDRGSNQPNVFFDPKSSESFLPYFSRGWRDETIQRAYIEAVMGFWNDPANNPVSSVYSGPMLNMASAAFWTWDARPFPAFPGRPDVWKDASNWTRGHWLTGRLGGSGLSELVTELCSSGTGVDPSQIDAADLEGELAGFAITAVESPRASIARLSEVFGFDAFESLGKIKFSMRHRRKVATVPFEKLVAAGAENQSEFSLVREQETELPVALKWRFLNPDKLFTGLTVEARRLAVFSQRIALEEFAMAINQSAADRYVRRALWSTWVAREGASFSLPPSFVALDPSDVLEVEIDGQFVPFAISRVTDSEARAVDGSRSDPELSDIWRGAERPIELQADRVEPTPLAVAMSLPQLLEGFPAHQPYAAAAATPWPGSVNIWSADPGSAVEGFSVFSSIPNRGVIGRLSNALPAGPRWRWDRGSSLDVVIEGASLQSVTEAQVLSGANAAAVQVAADVWEIIQFATADLVGNSTWRLSDLLRGQRGTEVDAAPGAQPGAVFVLLNSAIVTMPFEITALGAERDLSFIPEGLAPGDLAALDRPGFTVKGRGLRPFAPGQLRRVDLSNGDVRLSWLRRSRAIEADDLELLAVPLLEPALRFDVEILDGATVVRSFDLLEDSDLVYSASDILSDFGVARPSEIRLRVWQVGDRGRGDAADEVLPLVRREDDP